MGKTPTFANTLSAIGDTIEQNIVIQDRTVDHHENKWGALTGAEQKGERPLSHPSIYTNI